MRTVFPFVSLFVAVVCAKAISSWPVASMEMNPWIHNWWMGSAVDTVGLEAQCIAFERAGIFGGHVIPIYGAKEYVYGAKEYENQCRTYLTLAWMKAFKFAVDTAVRHGLGVDMTMGCDCFWGGPQLRPGHGCWKPMVTSYGELPYVIWSLTKQQVKRAGPGGIDPMMDTFSDVPETEMFVAVNHDILVPKFVPSAAHVIGDQYGS